MNSTERKQLNAIHGIDPLPGPSNNANKSNGMSPWRRPATAIAIPGAYPRQSTSHGRTAGLNPFNAASLGIGSNSKKNRTPLRSYMQTDSHDSDQSKKRKRPQPATTGSSSKYFDHARLPMNGTLASRMAQSTLKGGLEVEDDIEEADFAKPVSSSWTRNGKVAAKPHQAKTRSKAEQNLQILRETLNRSEESFDVIDVDEEGERAVEHSSDPLDCFAPSSSHSYGVNEDGPHTTRLKSKYGHAAEPGVKTIPEGNTLSKALNFSNVERNPNLQGTRISRMKGSKPPQSAGISTSQTIGKNAQANRKPNSTSAKPSTANFGGAFSVPLEAWIYDKKLHRAGDHDNEIHNWAKLDQKTNVLSISATPYGHPIYQFKLDAQVGLQYSSVDHRFPVIVIDQTLAIRGGSRKGKVALALRFNTETSFWKPQSYISLAQHLKSRIQESSELKGSAVRSAWEAQERLTSKPPRNRSNQTARGTAKLSLEARTEEMLTISDDDNEVQVNGRSKTPEDNVTRREPRKPPGPKPRARFGGSGATRSEGVRRSTRHSAPSRIPSPEPTPGNDETVLIYPPVMLTNADLRRLDPFEFLNDKLIEFGLKLWLNDLRDRNPELADQVHVFNSFLYKKLDVKNPSDAYNSVRKWTAKFDLFKKKFLIIPINEHAHWYLAIVYQPEHVLLPPLEVPTSSPTVTTRRQAHLSEAENVSQIQLNAPLSPMPVCNQDHPNDHPLPDQTSEPENGARPEGPDHDRTDSEGEMEVEQALHSCSISDDTELLRIEDDPPEAMDCDMSSVPSPPPELDYVDLPAPEQSADAQMYIEHKEPLTEELAAHQPMEDRAINDGSDRKPEKPVSVKNFYGKTFSRSRESSTSRLVSSTRDDEDAETVDGDDTTLSDRDEPEQTQQTWIFTLDSLNSKHRRAENVLTSWLQAEAQDKKKVEQTRRPNVKQALVPTQPNFSDCGLYLIHFVKVFMSNPEHYAELILTSTRSRKYSADQISARDAEWRSADVASMREELGATIKSLSDVWVKEKEAQAAEEKPNEVEQDRDGKITVDSDDDVQILEDHKALSPKRPPAKKPRLSPPEPVLRLRDN